MLFAAYSDARQKLGRPPRSLEELKARLETYGASEQRLISPRDGAPYVIVWGVDMHDLRNLDPPAVIAYEREGADGQRVVLTIMGVVRMTEDEFTRLKLPRETGG
jgi:hypothetical protein